MENYEILWKSIRGELEKICAAITYATYFENLIPVDIVGERIILIANTKFYADTVNQKLRGRMLEALAKTESAITDFLVVVAEDKEDYLNQVENSEIERGDIPSNPINPNFTFDSFVVGPSNEFAFAAGKAVTENPGEAYNPLYIYGGSGLGKTHLLMAIANQIKKYKPGLRVLYATCEQFTNQLVESLSKGKGNGLDFRHKYRNVDVLLIDDVQFLAKRQGIQMEFFHTFNELVMQNKQIVLTSDCPPKDIEVLEERLRTRFEGGLVADIQPPNIETRIAILRKKSEEKKCLMNMDVLTHIAEIGDEDIRSLIGKLTKVIFFSKLQEKPITCALVDEAIKESVNEKQEQMKVEDIISCVSNFYKINKNDLLSKKKNKEFVEPRQVCMYVITDLMSSLPLAVVGQKMGGKDHATVIYSRDKIAEQIKTDNRLSRDINDIKKMLLKQ